MADIFNMTDTWNDSGVTFSAIKMDVTDTASDAGSTLLDLQVGGAKHFEVTNARQVSLYNTYTDASNYERGALSWDILPDSLVLQPQKAGTGASRQLWIRGVGASYARFKTDNTIDVSGGGGVNVTFKSSTTEFLDTPVIAADETVATLPGTPKVGMMARVTDATSPATGSTVTGGGADPALVWYNGANWTVIGV